MTKAQLIALADEYGQDAGGYYCIGNPDSEAGKAAERFGSWSGYWEAWIVKGSRWEYRMRQRIPNHVQNSAVARESRRLGLPGYRDRGSG